MKPAKSLTAISFLLFLAAMLAVSLFHISDVEQTLRDRWRDAETGESLADKAAFVAAEGESALSANLDPERWFIQIYGGAQRLMGRRYVADVAAGNSVVKLDSGALSFFEIGGEPPDTSENAAKTIQLARDLEVQGIPFLMAVAPQKVADQSDLPAGLAEHFNAAGDQFLALLTQAGVDSFDLRPAFDSRTDRDGLFFRTDHHWRGEGAQYAYALLSGELSARYGFPENAEALNPGNYDWVLYEDWFLGSQGKRVGSLYAGTDDFTAAAPKFETDFTYVAPGGTRTGSFETSLCFPERLAERDLFNENPYVYYSGGDYGQASMINHRNPDGPRILLIRESFSCAFAPFLALGCSELTTVDLRYLDRPLQDVVEEARPDLVLMLYCASSTRLPELFDW